MTPSYTWDVTVLIITLVKKLWGGKDIKIGEQREWIRLKVELQFALLIYHNVSDHGSYSKRARDIVMNNHFQRFHLNHCIFVSSAQFDRWLYKTINSNCTAVHPYIKCLYFIAKQLLLVLSYKWWNWRFQFICWCRQISTRTTMLRRM